jgi:uncharacterized protein
MVERLFVDTSAIYAYINAKDPDHDRIKDFLNGFEGDLLTSNFVFDEIITLVLARMGHGQAVLTGQVLLNPNVFIMIRVGLSDERNAWELFLNRQDKTYSFTDCTSFVIMRKMDIIRYLALDPHFQQEGFQDATLI